MSGNLDAENAFPAAEDQHVVKDNGGSFHSLMNVVCTENLAGSSVDQTGNTGVIGQEDVGFTVFVVQRNRGTPCIIAGGNLPDNFAGFLIKGGQQTLVG